MSSGSFGGFFDGAGRSSTISTPTNFTSAAAAAFETTTSLLGPQQQQQNNHFSFPSPMLPDPITQIQRPDMIGKRSLADFQRHGLGFYLRNVKPRPSNNTTYQHPSPISPLSQVDLSPIRQQSDRTSRYNFPVMPLEQNVNSISNNAHTLYSGGVDAPCLDKNTVMTQRLKQLEKQLLGDDDDDVTGENISIVTSNEWSETFHDLLRPTPKLKSLSPTSSSSSSCSSTLASPPFPNPKQSLIDAAIAVSDNKSATAKEILTRLEGVACAKGTPEQRLTHCMLSALKSRVNPAENQPVVSELYGEEHESSIQMLYDASPCFKLGFMSANLAVVDATTGIGFDKIHVLDFDIGHGKQYVHLLHVLSSSRKMNSGGRVPTSLTVTTLSERAGGERLKRVGEGLKSLAEKIGFPLNLQVMNFNLTDLTREKLKVQADEALVVNFTYRLYKIPDESVTTENIRDELLRRVKSLSPEVVTVVEQELNSNTAPLVTRVRDACDHYGALLESLDTVFARDSVDRVRIEMGLARRICNTVACEGRERVERCEVFGKWRARMGMAGFKARPISPKIGESLRSKLNSGTRGNHGFTVSEEAGGVSCGWRGKTLTVASAWQ